jgi:hypothetical protein
MMTKTGYICYTKDGKGRAKYKEVPREESGKFEARAGHFGVKVERVNEEGGTNDGKRIHR